MSNRIQFELNFLCDSALIIYVNLQLLFLTVHLNHPRTRKWCHDDTETLIDPTSIDFYLFFIYTNKMQVAMVLTTVLVSPIFTCFGGWRDYLQEVALMPTKYVSGTS